MEKDNGYGKEEKAKWSVFSFHIYKTVSGDFGSVWQTVWDMQKDETMGTKDHLLPLLVKSTLNSLASWEIVSIFIAQEYSLVSFISQNTVS